MIIFEGADGTGKTTAAKFVAQALGVHYMHSPGPYVDRFSPIFNFHVARPQEVVIYDRFYFSELVYGPILRDEIRIPAWFIEAAEKLWLPATRPLVVWCSNPVEQVIKNLEGTEQLEGVRENIANILDAYEYLFNVELPERLGSSMPWVIHHDWTKRPIDMAAIESWVMLRRGGKR